MPVVMLARMSTRSLQDPSPADPRRQEPGPEYHLDILVNNAAFQRTYEAIDEITADDSSGRSRRMCSRCSGSAARHGWPDAVLMTRAVHNRNTSAAISVGTEAPARRYTGETVSSKNLASSA
jgi:hypothetical protein